MSFSLWNRAGLNRASIIAGFSILLAGAVSAAPRQDAPGSGIGVTTRNVAPPAGAETLPTAEEVIENYIKATGGREAYAKLHDRVMEGTLSLPQMNLKGPLNVHMAEPALVVTVMELPGAGKTRQGVKDGVAWELTDMNGPRLLEGEELASGLRSAAFNGELKWKELYKSVECVAVETIDGNKTYKLVFTPHEGAESSQFYDAATHLLVLTRSVVKTPMGDIPVESTTSDYREVDGVRIPFKNVQAMPNVTIEILFTSVKHNVDVPPSTFDLPEEIKKLVDKKKAKEAQPTAPAGSTPTPPPAPPAPGGNKP